MQETKTNALGIRITDGELRRLEAIRGGLGLPSMTITMLGHDLLVKGMEEMERRGKGMGIQERAKGRKPRTGEAKE